MVVANPSISNEAKAVASNTHPDKKASTDSPPKSAGTLT